MTVLTTVDVIDGTTIDATDVNANMAAVRTVINGGIDNGNIHAAAAIAISKLAGYPGDVTKILYGDGTWAAAPAGGSGGGVTPPFPASYIAGYPADPTKFLRGDGAWASVMVAPAAIGGYPSNGQLSLRGDGTWGTAYTAASFIAGYPADPTKVLHGDGTWSVPSAAAGAPSYGTTLPGSPVDGQEAILVDSITGANYHWRFRYNAGSSFAEKWEFIGGDELVGYVQTQENQVTNVAYSDLATVGPAVTPPRTGIYKVTVGAAMQTTSQNGYMSYTIGATAPSDADAWVSGIASGSVTWQGHQMQPKSLTAGQQLIARYKAPAGSPWSKRYLSIIPVRVA